LLSSPIHLHGTHASSQGIKATATNGIPHCNSQSHRVACPLDLWTFAFHPVAAGGMKHHQPLMEDQHVRVLSDHTLTQHTNTACKHASCGNMKHHGAHSSRSSATEPTVCGLMNLNYYCAGQSSNPTSPICCNTKLARSELPTMCFNSRRLSTLSVTIHR
jgi:hypothetical protein